MRHLRSPLLSETGTHAVYVRKSGTIILLSARSWSVSGSLVKTLETNGIASMRLSCQESVLQARLTTGSVSF